MLVTCPTIATDESLQVPVEHVRRAVGLNKLEVMRGRGCDDRVEPGRFRELKRCAVKDSLRSHAGAYNSFLGQLEADDQCSTTHK